MIFPAINFSTNTVLDTSNNRSAMEYDESWHIATAFFLSLGVICMIVTVIAGNLLVLYVFLKERTLRLRVQYRFIASMAVADLLVGSLIIPITLVYKVLGYWPFGSVVCDLWLAADVLLCTASMQHICVIGIDRYLVLTHPIYYGQRRGPRTVYGLIGVTWFAATMIALPPLIGWHIEQEPFLCELTTNTAYIIYSASGSFFIPMIVICLVYKGIFRIAKKRQRKNRQSLMVKKKIIENSVANTNAVSSNQGFHKLHRMNSDVQRPLLKDFDLLKVDPKTEYKGSEKTARRRKRSYKEKRRQSSPAILCISEMDEHDDELEEFCEHFGSNGCFLKLSQDKDRRKSWSPAKISDAIRKESTEKQKQFLILAPHPVPTASSFLMPPPGFPAPLSPPALQIVIEPCTTIGPENESSQGSAKNANLVQTSNAGLKVNMAESNPHENRHCLPVTGGKPSITTDVIARPNPRRPFVGKSSMTSLRSNSSTDTCFAAEIVQARIDHVRKREKQSAVLLGTILTAFVICWCPFFVIYLMRGICCVAPTAIFDVFFFLGYCNSGLNPLLYGLFNTDFRKAFRKAFHSSKAYYICFKEPKKTDVVLEPMAETHKQTGKAWITSLSGKTRVNQDPNNKRHLKHMNDRSGIYADCLL